MYVCISCLWHVSNVTQAHLLFVLHTRWHIISAFEIDRVSYLISFKSLSSEQLVMWCRYFPSLDSFCVDHVLTHLLLSFHFMTCSFPTFSIYPESRMLFEVVCVACVCLRIIISLHHKRLASRERKEIVYILTTCTVIIRGEH